MRSYYQSPEAVGPRTKAAAGTIEDETMQWKVEPGMKSSHCKGC